MKSLVQQNLGANLIFFNSNMKIKYEREKRRKNKMLPYRSP
jgi:hypothetical protein